MAEYWKIYTGDYSEDGYEDGLENAKDGLAKNKYKFFKVLHPVNYVWNFNTAYNSYMKKTMTKGIWMAKGLKMKYTRQPRQRS